MTRDSEIRALESEWANNPRWKGIERDYSAEEAAQATA